jgi:hypothetical protein
VVDWRGQRRRRVHSAREAKGKDGSMSGYHEVYRPDLYINFGMTLTLALLSQMASSNF